MSAKLDLPVQIFSRAFGVLADILPQRFVSPDPLPE
jgi:hypothetical protein